MVHAVFEGEKRCRNKSWETVEIKELDQGKSAGSTVEDWGEQGSIRMESLEARNELETQQKRWKITINTDIFSTGEARAVKKLGRSAVDDNGVGGGVAVDAERRRVLSWGYREEALLTRS
nr:hypothetical protein CFP56_55978 [Quercus suber]